MSSVGWLAALSGPAGPLSGPAMRAAEHLGSASTFPRGATGLARLREALLRQVADHHATEEGDRRWVEAHGALLGLLLLDALGGRGHVEKDGRHRLAIGIHGAYDPFGGIEAALHHDDPRAEFIRQVGLAEAEAAGDGPISQVVSEFASVLSRVRPELKIIDQFELMLRLGPEIEIDLTRVARSTTGAAPSSLTLACEKLVGMLPGGLRQHSDLPWGDAAERLMPRVIGEAFLKELGPQRRDAVFQLPLATGLYLALQLEYPGRSRFLRGDEVEAWPLPEGEVIQRALNNLATRSSGARFTKKDYDGGTMVLAQSRDGWDASRLVLPGLYDVLNQHLTPPFAVCAPHRDELLACSLADAGSVAALRARARQDAARAPHAVSADVFRLSEEGLASLPEAPFS